MTAHHICLESFIPQGKVSVSTDKDKLRMTTNTAINTLYLRNDNPIKSYAYLSEKFKLPFRIDMTVKIDSPAMYLIIGKGHIGFATGGMDNRRITDILGKDSKPNTHIFDNDIPVNVYVDISVTYGSESMWVIVNDELRCFSNKSPYIKALKNDAVLEELSEGLGFAIACDKRTQLSLKSLTITEYEQEEPVAPAESFEKELHPPGLSISEKPTIEACIQGLTLDLQKEILRTDEYLLKDMKKSLKFKRRIEGGYPCGRITYTSPWGFRYKINISDAYVCHDINWISYNTKREQEKYGGYKKADYTVEALNKLAEDSPEFADEMFFRIKECVVCTGGSPCPNKWMYEYNGKKKRGCGWGDGIQFKMFPSDFEDLRKVVDAISDVLIKDNLLNI